MPAVQLFSFPHFAGVSAPYEREAALICAFLERAAGRLPAVVRTAAHDFHMLRVTPVVRIVNTFYRFAVDADDFFGMLVQGVGRLIRSLLPEALAAGVLADIISPLQQHWLLL